jgi:hypothetical protein
MEVGLELEPMLVLVRLFVWVCVVVEIQKKLSRFRLYVSLSLQHQNRSGSDLVFAKRTGQGQDLVRLQRRHSLLRGKAMSKERKRNR